MEEERDVCNITSRWGYPSEKRSYFLGLQFEDRNVRELVSGIESVLAGPDNELKTQVRVRLDKVMKDAKTKGFVGDDYKPRLFKRTRYETYLRSNLDLINREFKLGIRA